MGGCDIIELSSCGAKNVALALLPSIIMTKHSISFENLPNITDVNLQLLLNKKIGVQEVIQPDGKYFRCGDFIDSFIPRFEGSQLRSTLYYLGALASRTGLSVSPHPGGCAFAYRNFQLHVDALRHMGADVNVTSNQIIVKRTSKTADNIRLPIASRGVTGNLILYSLHKRTNTIIENANTSLEIVQLVNLLNQIGYDICICNNDIIIYGKGLVEEQNSFFTVTLPFDRVEAATYIILALLTNKHLCLLGINDEASFPFLRILDSMNARYSISKGQITIAPTINLVSTTIRVGVDYIDSDYAPILLSLLSIAHGKSEIIDYDKTYRIDEMLDQLRYIGVSYTRISNNHYFINGPCKLSSSKIILNGNDIRTTMGYFLFSLICEGDLKVSGYKNINRGYEDFGLKFPLFRKENPFI